MSLLKRLFLFVFILTSVFTFGQNIPASEASKHVGKQETVCGKIAESFTAAKSRGIPPPDHTICNLPRSYGERIRGQMISVLKK